jgi:hypothetical protein
LRLPIACCHFSSIPFFAWVIACYFQIAVVPFEQFIGVHSQDFENVWFIVLGWRRHPPVTRPELMHEITVTRSSTSIRAQCSCGWCATQTRRQNALADAKLKAAIRAHIQAVNAESPQAGKFDLQE